MGGAQGEYGLRVAPSKLFVVFRSACCLLLVNFLSFAADMTRSILTDSSVHVGAEIFARVFLIAENRLEGGYCANCAGKASRRLAAR